jgi:hypothetical protein
MIRAVRSRPPAVDAGLLVARLARLTGSRGPTLARIVGLSAGRLESLAVSRPATPGEERALVDALRRAGGTLDGLTR